MQYGDEELPDFEDFLPRWITYLGNKAGHDADRLILEAVSLRNNVSYAFTAQIFRRTVCGRIRQRIEQTESIRLVRIFYETGDCVVSAIFA